MTWIVWTLPFAVFYLRGVNPEDVVLRDKDKDKSFKDSLFLLLICTLDSWTNPHLHPVPDLHKSTGGVEGSSATGVQVSTVVVVHDLHIVHTVRL